MPANKLKAADFYSKILNIIVKSKVPFLIGGGFAVYKYTNLRMPTKDLDIFCKAGDFPKIVSILKAAGINIKVLDERWLAQVKEFRCRFDLLFSSPNYLISVDDNWFKHAKDSRLFGFKVKVMPPEELIWCKTYVADRSRFDGADINHLILIVGKQLDWRRILARMENHWEILFSLIINFRFIYPSERELIPKWLLDELITRLTFQLTNPTPIDKICRGPLLSRTQYKLDLEKLGFETIT
ncbi:hypothetical protein HY383_03015 [Candidatus Daviesbacteria bacterium]|nr:hypothetical protein [Candidatus Daviesbacteria bacterium]